MTSRCRWSEWSVCLPEHHPGYVSWPEYLQTRERLRVQRETARRGRRRRPRGRRAAAGPGALRALRPAHAGRLFRNRRQRAALCVRRAATCCMRTGQTCQSLGGGRLDQAVAAAFLEAVTPAGRRRDRRRGPRARKTNTTQRLAGQRLALERAEFEADRARRQFDACEPEHRLVARTLERALEDALAARRARTQASSPRSSRPARRR